MMDMLSFAFMQRAFIAGLALALVVPCVGVIVVLKRLSMIGDALSHASLAGVAAGMLMGVNPIAGALVACVIAALSIEAIRRRLPNYAEMAIAIVLSAGVGLAGLLSGFISNGAGFQSFLFGSIVAISDGEFYGILGISAGALALFLMLYRPLFAVAMDETAARLSGVPVGAVNFVFTLMTALVISVASRTVGALIVSSLMVVPVAAAMQLSGSFRSTVLLSAAIAVLSMAGGLTLSFYFGFRPGGAVVLLSILLFLLAAIGKKISGRAL